MKSKKIVLCNRNNHSNCLIEAKELQNTLHLQYVISKNQIHKVEREIMGIESNACNFSLNSFLCNGQEYGLITMKEGN